MATRALPVRPEQASQLLLAVQVGDAVACAIPLRFIQEELDRLGCPRRVQRAIPIVKGASAVGLLAGRRRPGLGLLTTDALVAYFVCALGAHARVRDPAWRWAAATGMLALTLVARRAYVDADVIDLTGETDTGRIATQPVGDRQDDASAPTTAEPAET